jgi:hypothetical protein
MMTDVGENSRPDHAQVDSQEVRVQVGRDLLDRLDAWVAAQPEPRPSRSEAILRILSQALGGTEAGSIDVEDLNASNDE